MSVVSLEDVKAFIEQSPNWELSELDASHIYLLSEAMTFQQETVLKQVIGRTALAGCPLDEQQVAVARELLDIKVEG